MERDEKKKTDEERKRREEERRDGVQHVRSQYRGCPKVVMTYVSQPHGKAKLLLVIVGSNLTSQLNYPQASS